MHIDIIFFKSLPTKKKSKNCQDRLYLSYGESKHMSLSWNNKESLEQSIGSI